MWGTRCRFALVLGFCLLVMQGRAEAQAPAPEPRQDSPDFWPAAAGVAGVNLFTWAYNSYVQRWPWARVGTRSWGQNLTRGFVWDDNGFLANQFAHPFHGSFYHSSARASGFGFWTSVPFVAAGSTSWELFGETITASLNDLITTTLGGVALGEVTYRLSTLLGSRRGERRNGFGRELAAFVLSPMTRTQGLLHPQSSVQGRIAETRAAGPAHLSMGRWLGLPFVGLAVRYGSPFDPGIVKPYDMFEFRVQLSPYTRNIIQHLGISGLLTRTSLARSDNGQLVLGVFQHYDYEDLPALQTSGHSLSTALVYRHDLGHRTRLNLSMHGEGLILGSITSEHGNYWRRDYDLGPGAGARLGASLVSDSQEWLRVDSRVLWLHSIHGSGGDHLATFVRVGATVPLLGPVGIGGDVAVTTRHSSFPEQPDVRRRVQHLRAYVTLAPQ